MNIDEIMEDAFGQQWNDHSMWRQRPYDGQPHTDNGVRGHTEIKGITFRDLRDCFVRAICLSAHYLSPALYDEANKGERGCICENDLYSLNLNDLDVMAIAQNLSCEVERVMGIYPNVPELKKSSL